MDKALKFAFGSLVVSFVVLAIKYVAFAVTGSLALYSDFLESIINVGTSVAAIVAIRVSALPPDPGHPFGHHKAEYLSAVLIGVMIIIASLLILDEAWNGFLNPTPIEAPALGLAVSMGATALNAVWGLLIIRFGKRARSASLVADGRHMMADVMTSIGVLVGVVLVVVTGIAVLDAAIAGLVALHILWSGFSVLRESASALLDESVPAETLETIHSIIASHAPEAIEAHDLRTRHAGKATFIDFHLVVASQMTISRAHAVCDRLEAALEKAIEGALVTIHIEPENKAKHKGIVIH
ncbi:cation diffusion facilitator family transporter [Kaistia terrae]|uniref:Cation diffusion facilitator family transporter n=1 Tax=Kaistia terrae TaxID=537017 RepID=A0ABW0PZ61_9HYPH|nr:cation diffusion facilitator family transporter [Kaistia terrae]MCX5580517.1 cation diffusion facilitator family transporter [Kaistia terrae]